MGCTHLPFTSSDHAMWCLESGSFQNMSVWPLKLTTVGYCSVLKFDGIWSPQSFAAASHSEYQMRVSPATPFHTMQVGDWLPLMDGTLLVARPSRSGRVGAQRTSDPMLSLFGAQVIRSLPATCWDQAIAGALVLFSCGMAPCSSDIATPPFPVRNSAVSRPRSPRCSVRVHFRPPGRRCRRRNGPPGPLRSPRPW